MVDIGVIRMSMDSDYTFTFNSLRPRGNRRHYADDMFKCIFLNVSVWTPIEISLTFVPKGSINNNPALFQIMAWRRRGDKPLSEPMMVSSLTHICVTRPQCVNGRHGISCSYTACCRHIGAVFNGCFNAKCCSKLNKRLFVSIFGIFQ